MTRDAIILAAGFGSRLKADEGHKILAHVGGEPLIDFHLRNFAALGVEVVTIVTGFKHNELEAQLRDWPTPAGVSIQFAHNPEFELSNGVSVLAGARAASGPFWLVMSDHIFQPSLMPKLRAAAPSFETAAGMLGVDAKLNAIFDMPDANKVRLKNDGSLDAIGKEIEPYNWVDVGLFWCGSGFVSALEAELESRGDCSTSDAVKRLDAAQTFIFWDVEESLWQDVDTPGARAHAETLIAAWKKES